ncbi:MAG: VOC family protein [Solirubrobacteraceae bacterium]
MRLARVYESVLYAEDVPTVAAFYRDVLGLGLVDGPGELMAAFRLPDGGLLLIFDPGRSARPGRQVPSHGARGAGHIAFQVDPPQLGLWRTHLRELGIEIESERSDADGAGQLYFRDPAGNSVEIVEGDIWPL